MTDDDDDCLGWLVGWVDEREVCMYSDEERRGREGSKSQQTYHQQTTVHPSIHTNMFAA